MTTDESYVCSFCKERKPGYPWRFKELPGILLCTPCKEKHYRPKAEKPQRRRSPALRTPGDREYGETEQAE